MNKQYATKTFAFLSGFISGLLIFVTIYPSIIVEASCPGFNSLHHGWAANMTVRYSATMDNGTELSNIAVALGNWQIHNSSLNCSFVSFTAGSI